MSEIQELTSLKDLETLLEARKGAVVFIEFYATWCGPCRAIAPKYEALAKQYEAHAIFARADVDEALDLSKTYSIRSMPTFVVLRDGEQVEVQKGPSPPALQALVKKWAESFETFVETPTPRELETVKKLEAGFGSDDSLLQIGSLLRAERIRNSGIASVAAAGLLWGVWLWAQGGLPSFAGPSSPLV